MINSKHTPPPSPHNTVHAHPKLTPIWPVPIFHWWIESWKNYTSKLWFWSSNGTDILPNPNPYEAFPSPPLSGSRTARLEQKWNSLRMSSNRFWTTVPIANGCLLLKWVTSFSLISLGFCTCERLKEWPPPIHLLECIQCSHPDYNLKEYPELLHKRKGKPKKKKEQRFIWLYIINNDCKPPFK